MRAIRKFKERNQKKEGNSLEGKKFGVLIEKMVEAKDYEKWENKELVAK
jgi:hypothetical protein